MASHLKNCVFQNYISALECLVEVFLHFAFKEKSKVNINIGEIVTVAKQMLWGER